MIGTFSDTENADTCTECPTGYTTSKEGSDQRKLCTGGKFYILNLCHVGSNDSSKCHIIKFSFFPQTTF